MQKFHMNDKTRKVQGFTSDDDDDDDYENVSAIKMGPTVPSRSTKGIESVARRDDLTLKCSDMPVKRLPSVWTTVNSSAGSQIQDVSRFQPPSLGLNFSSPAVNEAFRDVIEYNSQNSRKRSTKWRFTLILVTVLIFMFILGTIITTLLFIKYTRITAEILALKQNVSEVQKVSNSQQDSLRMELGSVNKAIDSNILATLLLLQQNVSQWQEAAKKEHDNLKAEITENNRRLGNEQDGLKTEVRNINSKLDSLCPPGWKLMGFSCYFFSTTPLTWDDSKNDCIKRNGVFLILTGQKEMDALKPVVGSKRYWIGLRKQSNTWKWEDGTTLTYSNWHPNEPNNAASVEHCAEIVSGGWNDLNCKLKIDYICKGTWSC